MLEYFQENAKLTYHTKLLQQKLKNIRKDDTNKMFWSDIAPRLMKIIYEQLVAEAELMVAGIKKAEEIIGSTTSKRQNESAIETRSKKQQKIKEMREEDYDVNIYIYISEERCISYSVFKFGIRNGLSSILDLVDASSLSQKSLFTEEAWSDILSLFQSELALELVQVPSDMANAWLIISKVSFKIH
jgi:hypothetical protein